MNVVAWMRILFILLCTIFVTIPSYGAPLPPSNAVASAVPAATKAGLTIIREGGNAFDAAVTIAAVLAVAEPYDSGLGGGGFWLFHVAKGNKNVFIDSRETAPQHATPTMYQGEVSSLNNSLNGPLSAAIPGEVAGMVYVQKHYGRLSLERELDPAIELAEKDLK